MDAIWDAAKPLPPSQPTVTVIPNPPTVERIGDLGHSTLWIVFAIMFLSTLGFIGLSWRVAVSKRLFYQVTTFITVFATLSYYAMASGSGYSFHRVHVTQEHDHDLPDTHKIVYRQVFYARYLDWALTTPLLLLDLALLAGLNGSNIVNVIVADLVMIFTGLFAAYAPHKRQGWGWYVMGWVAFLVIIYELGVTGKANAQARGTTKLFVPLAIYTAVLWTLYPIVWAVADGTRTLSPDWEVVAYAVLDVLAKPVFGAALLVLHARTPASDITLNGTWSEGLGNTEGTLRVGDDDDA